MWGRYRLRPIVNTWPVNVWSQFVAHNARAHYAIFRYVSGWTASVFSCSLNTYSWLTSIFHCEVPTYEQTSKPSLTQRWHHKIPYTWEYFSGKSSIRSVVRSKWYVLITFNIRLLFCLCMLFVSCAYFHVLIHVSSSFSEFHQSYFSSVCVFCYPCLWFSLQLQVSCRVSPVFSPILDRVSVSLRVSFFFSFFMSASPSRLVFSHPFVPWPFVLFCTCVGFTSPVRVCVLHLPGSPFPCVVPCLYVYVVVLVPGIINLAKFLEIISLNLYFFASAVII